MQLDSFIVQNVCVEMLLGDKNYQSAYLGKHAIGMQTIHITSSVVGGGQMLMLTQPLYNHSVNNHQPIRNWSTVIMVLSNSSQLDLGALLKASTRILFAFLLKSKHHFKEIVLISIIKF